MPYGILKRSFSKSVRQPADGPPIRDLMSEPLGWANDAALAAIDQLQMNASLIVVSKILSVRRNMSIHRRIA